MFRFYRSLIMQLIIGQRTSLRAVVYDDESPKKVIPSAIVTWTVDDDTIVSVQGYDTNNVDIKALAVGTAVLTATYEGITNTYTVTVVEAQIPDSITIIESGIIF